MRGAATSPPHSTRDGSAPGPDGAQTVSRSTACHHGGLALFAVIALALGVRALLAPEVFGEQGIYFDRADSQYHLRRAYYSYREFPAVLMSDPYVNHPGGAPVPWPPLFDLLLGSAAALLASDDAGFERVVAWANPLIGALACLPIFLAGRRLAGVRIGLGSAALYALLPVGVMYSRVGDVDHHALVAMLGAWLMALCLRAVDSREASDIRGSAMLALALAFARAAMMLSWHGSLLYVALVEGTILLAATLQTRRALFVVEAVSLLGSLAILVPVVLASPTPLGGPFSSIALSWLHVGALACAAAAAGGMAFAIEIRAARAGWARRIAVLTSAGVVPVLALLALPSVREGLEPALQFLTMSDAMGMQTAEQRPLLPIAPVDRDLAFPMHLSFGFFGYALPAIPIWLAWKFRRPSPRRGVGLTLAAWTAFFVLLAIPQYRYANDLGPGIAVAFAIAIGSASAWLRRAFHAPHPFFGPAFSVGIALWLLAPPITDLYFPWIRKLNASIHAAPAGSAGSAPDRLVDPVNRSLALFLKEVRRTTPQTSGFLDSTVAPEYGIVADADIGHAIQYIARRPTPTDPFWSYIGEQNWAGAHALLASLDEDSAVDLAERLKARYVVTVGRGEPGTLAARLHAWDGSSAGNWGALEHFRLITEGPARGTGLPGTGQRGVSAPYKLFEIVSGARIDVSAPAGEEVRARIVLETPIGRRVPYRTSAIAGPDGVAILRLPHSTERVASDASRKGAGAGADAERATRATGPWTLRTESAKAELEISDEQVRAGSRSSVAASAFRRSQ